LQTMMLPGDSHALVLLYTVAAVATTAAANTPPQQGPRAILTVIIDDMGWHDSQPHNPRAPTPTLGALAAEGILLERHYAYVFCSPTRRSFLTGRFPVHIVGVQADVCSNWTPLGMTLLAGKLANAGFQSHFIGKTNIGFQTTDHMPINRNFTSHVGFLYGAEDYALGHHPLYMLPGAQARAASIASDGTQHCRPYLDPECMAEGDMRAHTTSKFFALDFWEDDHPGWGAAQRVYYSTNFYTERTLAILRNFSAAAVDQPPEEERAAELAPARLWVHLCYQAVHSPFTDVPGATSVASFLAAVLTEIYLCNVCSCTKNIILH
jgi:arylsulfatase A-like enzyme